MTYIEAMRELDTNENWNSNWVANVLMEVIGIMSLNKTQKNQGYNETSFVDYYRPGALYRGNKTSANNTGRAVLDMVVGKGLDDKHHKIALEVLNGKRMMYAIRDPNNPDGIDPENILMKHGQSEQDISVTYRMKGKQDGKQFDGIVVLTLSDINKGIVKSDFKTPTPFGMEIMRYFINASRQVSKIAQSLYIGTNQKSA